MIDELLRGLVKEPVKKLDGNFVDDVSHIMYRYYMYLVFIYKTFMPLLDCEISILLKYFLLSIVFL